MIRRDLWDRAGFSWLGILIFQIRSFDYRAWNPGMSAEMAYQYDIFISYKRHPETLRWIKQHFRPLLEHRVGLALGTDPRIYVHDVAQQIPAGAIWPQLLGEELGASKVLVALWTKTFFSSVWCMREMSHMLGREQETGATRAKYGLVIPAVIHDCDDSPQTLQYIERMDIRSCYNTRMRVDSAKAEELDDLIEVHAAGIADAIRHAPDWKPAWPRVAADAFFDEFYKVESPAQTEVPKFQPK
jgi:TIR domain